MMRSSVCIFITMFFAGGAVWAAPVTYSVTVNTASISGDTGSVDFQFNPGPLPGQTADVQILNFSSNGALVPGNASTVGDVNGLLPSTVTMDTAQYALNDYFEGFTYGSTLSFEVNLYGPALSSPNGSAGGNSFAFSMFSDPAGTRPALTSDTTYGVAFDIGVDTDGTTTLTNNSQQTSVTAIPEPNGLIVIEVGLVIACTRRRMKRQPHFGKRVPERSAPNNRCRGTHP